MQMAPDLDDLLLALLPADYAWFPSHGALFLTRMIYSHLFLLLHFNLKSLRQINNISLTFRKCMIANIG
jgi:hypothetical protein